MKTINQQPIFIVLHLEKTYHHQFWKCFWFEKLKNIIGGNDILVDYLKVGGIDKFGLDYEGLKAI